MKKPFALFACIMFYSWAFCQDVARVHVINVGQGSATLLEFPCGAILIDTGGEENDQFHSTPALIEYLDEFFQRRTDLNKTLNLLIISHPHKDHTLGIKEVVAHYTIKNVVTNGQRYGSGKTGQIFLHETISATESTSDASDDITFIEGVDTSIPASGLTIPIFTNSNCSGALPTVKLLWGRMSSNAGWTSQTKFRNNNNHSIVVRIDYGQSSILFTGDLEEEAITRLLSKYGSSNILDTDIYVAGHHGSKNGSSTELISEISPEIAVLSFGDPDREEMWTGWQYGHPNKTIIDKLITGCSKFRTPVTVPVGIKSQTFTHVAISKAIYGTGWDGDIILEGTIAGEWTYKQEVDELPKININTADVATLLGLPSIGQTRAQAIVDYRNANGNFTKIEDLDNVPGIGPATITLIRSRVQI
jgi:competence protein ComEC